MSNRYEPNVESLDDRTLLAGGLWSTLSSLQHLFNPQGGSHGQGGAAEVSDSATVESQSPDPSAGGVWSLLDSFLNGSSSTGENAPSNPGSSASSANQGSSSWNWPGSNPEHDSPWTSGLGDFGGSGNPSDPGGSLSSLVQTVQGIIGEIAGFLNNLQGSFNFGNNSGGQDSPTSSPDLTGGSNAGNGTSVQWPFGSNGWPTWLPSFIQQNLSSSNGGPPASGGSDGGEPSQPSNPSTPPANTSGSSSSGKDAHGGAGGSANAGGTVDQPVDGSTGDTASPEEQPLLTNSGSARQPRESKIAMPPRSAPATETETASRENSEVETPAAASPEHPAHVVPAGESEARVTTMESRPDAEELRVLLGGTNKSIEITDEALTAADVPEEESDTLVAKSTMWLADLVSALTTPEEWDTETGDLFDRLPASLELEASNEMLAVSPLALAGTVSFAGGALYWQRFGRRRSTLVGANAVDEFFMNLSMDP